MIKVDGNPAFSEGFPEKIRMHCLGWCHIMTPVEVVCFGKAVIGAPKGWLFYKL